MIAIASMAKNRVIGKDNKLPWPPSKEDFTWFKEKTMNHVVLVGRTTYQNMPPLKGRVPIIISSTDLFPEPYVVEIGKDPSCIKADELQGNLRRNYENGCLSGDDLICIGGAKAYELCLPYCDSLFLTEWQFEVKGDTLMPVFDHLFPGRRKIKEIEGGKGIIWEYLSPKKIYELWKITVDKF